MLAVCGWVLLLLAGVPWALSAPARPNVLLILADDMGFSDLGCYGGEITTPNLDRLAQHGLRFTHFYNTARCWPTRACILTGYYAQQVRMDPRQGRLPNWARVLPQYLKPLGYRSYHAGKWHLFGAPRPVEDAGFDASYGGINENNHFRSRVGAQTNATREYHSSAAIADHAIAQLQGHQREHAGQPFFSYVAFIAPHFPLHAPPADIERYRDRYRVGWDAVREQRWQRLRALGIVNSPLPPLETNFAPRYFKPEFMEILGPGEVNRAVPWTQLTPGSRQFQASKMAVHAAMVEGMDREIGRLLNQVGAMGALENTVIFFLSDNGADATLLVRGEGHDSSAPAGSAKTFLCLGPGWASACNAPFRRHKIWTHEGGIATPLIVHWPRGIKARGELRHTAGHVIDFVPTLLELAGGSGLDPSPPGAPPLPGRSLVPALTRNEPVKREFLFFQHEGNRALTMGDWKLVSSREDGAAWELYNLREDRSELHNLASQFPDKVGELEAVWSRHAQAFTNQAGPPTPTNTRVRKRP